MPRAAITKGAAHWYSYKFHLDDDQRRRIFDGLMGFDWDDKKDRKKADQVILNIECFLGTYRAMLESTDNAPTAASYIAELTQLRKKAYNLIEDTANASYWMTDLIQAHGFDLGELSLHLAKFFDVTGKIIATKEKEESRGKPKKRAIKILVNTLHKHFQHYSRNKTALNAFIIECLDIADIKHPKNVLGLIYKENTPAAECEYIFQTG